MENHEDEIRLKVKTKLQTEQIKLWLPPYTVQNNDKGFFPQDLVDRFCRDLKLDEELVRTNLETLRKSAVERLAAKKQANQMTVKVKLAGATPACLTKEQKFFPLTIDGNELVSDIKHQISRHCGVPTEYLKLISTGKLLEDDHLLRHYQLKANSTLMAICLSETEMEARKEQSRAEKFARTRQGAELLAAQEDGGENNDSNYYVQITDQSGRPLQLPKEQRKALVLAMTLHEKGRSCLKRKEYGEALLLLMEADKEFKKCRSDIFSAVDNYAILCLDIVWCYLCLKNVNDLPDAEERLQKCDECFRKSYGPNLERLALVKGGTGSERALFMRLHLLQGVLAYHQNRISDAQGFFKRAESELKVLRIDDEKMSEMLTMGFTAQEARVALRLSEGNVQVAASNIFKRREEKKELRKKEKEDRRKKKLAQKLGKTAAGQPVDIDAYENLLVMGFPKGGSAAALRQTNNDLNAALQALTENPSLLTIPDPDAKVFELTDTMIQQMSVLGFDTDVARLALMHYQGVEDAIEALLRTGGAPLPEWFVSSGQTVHQATATIDLQNPTTSTNQPSTSAGPFQDEEHALIHDVVQDLPEGEDDYLDLTLDEEAQILQEYMCCLQSSQEGK